MSVFDLDTHRIQLFGREEYKAARRFHISAAIYVVETIDIQALDSHDDVLANAHSRKQQALPLDVAVEVGGCPTPLLVWIADARSSRRGQQGIQLGQGIWAPFR